MRGWQSIASLVLFPISGILVAYAIVQIFVIPFSIRSGSNQAAVSDLQFFRSTSLEPVEKYQRDFSSHALFSKPKAPVAAPVLGLGTLLKPYALTGIIQGGGPEAEALIENKTTKQTYYVRRGEAFDQFKVVQISPHGILVEHQGEQKELFIEGEIR